MGNPILEGKVGAGRFGAGSARYTLKIDSTQAGVEAHYFWVLRFLEGKPPYGMGYADAGEIIKTKDVFTAGESSAYWGSIEQRRGAQIDKFQQIMANIGQMLKTLFQLVRELRIMDERLELYTQSYAGNIQSEVALKDVWITLVEGGSRNPVSIYGMATQVQFYTLPEYFMNIHPKNKESAEQEAEKLKDAGVNKKVREVLARKLYQYLVWKERTYAELKTGREFRLKYLKQHYHVIRLYLNWLRPYLKNIQRLKMEGAASDANIVAAFETSKIELELLSVKKKYETDNPPYGKVEKEFEKYFPCVRVQIKNVAIPQMAFQEEFNRGPLHRGRTELVIEGYVVERKKKPEAEWKNPKVPEYEKDDVQEYITTLEKEDFRLLEAVDESITALREDIEYYLKEAGGYGVKEEKKEEPKKKESFFAPLKAIGGGMKELIKSLNIKSSFFSPPDTEKEAAERTASFDAYLVYLVFKKTHGMFAE